jgi:hypothetical protein
MTEVTLERHESEHVALRRRWMNGEVAILPELLDVVNCSWCEPLNPVELRPALEEVARVVDGAAAPMVEAATKLHRASTTRKHQTARDASAAKAIELDWLVEIARRHSVARWGILRTLAKSTGR